MTGPKPPIALGYLHQEISGDRERCDQAALVEWAARYGYHLALVTIGAGVAAPTLLLIQHIRDATADAVIAPTADHIWQARRAITELCDLVIVEPRQTWVRGHRRPPLREDLSPGRVDCTPMWGR